MKCSMTVNVVTGDVHVYGKITGTDQSRELCTCEEKLEGNEKFSVNVMVVSKFPFTVTFLINKNIGGSY